MHKLLLPLFLGTTVAIAPISAAPNSQIVAQSAANISASPFVLAYLAYQGTFEDQGIPANTALAMAVQTRRVTARQVVEAGIKANRVAAMAMNDQGYINSVERQLKSMFTQH